MSSVPMDSVILSLCLGPLLDAVQFALGVLVQRQRLVSRQNVVYFLAGFIENGGSAACLPSLKRIVQAKLADVPLTVIDAIHGGVLG